MLTSTLANYFRKKQAWFLFSIILVAIAVYWLLPASLSPQAKRMAAIFVIAAGFWAFEIIPLFATSLLIVTLLIFFTGETIFSKMNYLYFFSTLANPVIILFLGGFVLAEVVHEHKLDRLLMEKVLLKLGNRSSLVLFGFLGMSAFFSMWISNTATAALMLALIAPILAYIDEKDPLRKSLVIAIAFGANIGGIATPIGTPPNAIAIGILQDYGIYLDFPRWVIMAFPLTLVILALGALILYWMFPPATKHLKMPPYTIEPLTRKGKATLSISCLIILLWLTTPLHKIQDSVVALLGITLFSAFRLIDVDGIRRLRWDILLLMWGGFALGEGLERTELIPQLIKPEFLQFDLFLFTAIFCLIALFFSTFISNTATANIILPIMISFSAHDLILSAIAVTLCCSFALAFPISTPPNAMAYSMGTFQTKDMVKAGGILSIVALILVLSGFRFIIPLLFPEHFS